MIDLRALRENPEPFRASQRARGADVELVDRVIAADEARRAAETDVFSDIPLDAAPLPVGEDAQIPGDLDSIEF